MGLAVARNRLALVDERGAIDVAAISGGKFSPDPQAVCEQWAQFSVPHLIESLSAVVALLPGDLIFTGTAAGIGWVRDPKIVLCPGARLVTHAEVVGEMTATFTAA